MEAKLSEVVASIADLKSQVGQLNAVAVRQCRSCSLEDEGSSQARVAGMPAQVEAQARLGLQGIGMTPTTSQLAATTTGWSNVLSHKHQGFGRPRLKL